MYSENIDGMNYSNDLEQSPAKPRGGARATRALTIKQLACIQHDDETFYLGGNTIGRIRLSCCIKRIVSEGKYSTVYVQDMTGEYKIRVWDDVLADPETARVGEWADVVGFFRPGKTDKTVFFMSVGSMRRTSNFDQVVFHLAKSIQDEVGGHKKARTEGTATDPAAGIREEVHAVYRNNRTIQSGISKETVHSLLGEKHTMEQIESAIAHLLEEAFIFRTTENKHRVLEK
ncbi:MAG: putative replication factor A protein 2 [Amphiamblys sp. WSBS2006]|nr:MAG: putative replication factor A protein 2 [Amphiamblys sp. WSBS2006]